GCTVYDCFGAGQRVTQETFHGRRTRADAEMFVAFTVMRQLHEWLWYLGEILALPKAAPVHDAARASIDEVEALSGYDPEALAAIDLSVRWPTVSSLLQQASELARAGAAPGRELRSADLVGADLRGADLRRANLRGAYLIGADLTTANLTG